MHDYEAAKKAFEEYGPSASIVKEYSRDGDGRMVIGHLLKYTRSGHFTTHFVRGANWELVFGRAESERGLYPPLM